MQMDREFVQPFLTVRSNSRGDKLVEQYGELTKLAEKERIEENSKSGHV
jgi:hypothetical protein